MKKLRSFYRLPLFFILPFLIIFGCENDDEEILGPDIKGAYSDGVFVINEGNFGSDNSSISFYYPEKDSVVSNIFSATNGRKLGNTTQSMFIDDTLAYIVVNASNKLEVVSAGSFKSKGGIENGLSSPRYFTSLNDKGYITNWGKFDENFTQTEPPFIAVIDLITLEIMDTIQVGNGPENIISVNNKIFFSNNFGSTIGVIDPITLEKNEIKLSASPSAMVEGADGNLWVITGGDYGANNGKLYQIDPATETILATIELGLSPAGRLVTNETKNKIYYYAGKSVYEIDINASSAPTTPLLTNDEATGFYGLGYDMDNDELYLGDANGFQGSGTVYRYNLQGALLGSFETGVGPNGFVFN